MPETLYGGVQNRRVTIRDLQRATVSDIANTCEQACIANGEAVDFC